MFSILLVGLSGALTHIAVRHAQGAVRALLLFFCTALLGIALACSRVPGGFWSGFYTLISLYFMVCMTAPWVDLLRRSRRAP